MSTEIIRVPDIGGAADVDVIEINVSVGDMIEVDQPIIVLETDKASMDVPSPLAGKVLAISISEGDQVSEGSVVLELEVASTAEAPTQETVTPVVEPAQKEVSADSAATEAVNTETANKAVVVPDIGGATDVEVIEICVSEGDDVEEGDSLIVLETDKASMDIPAPFSGKVGSISLSIGDKVSEGSDMMLLSTTEAAPVKPAADAQETAVVIETVTEAPTTATTAGGVESVNVPDIGGATDVDIIEIAVAVGDKVSEGDSLIVLETDKASMEIPAPKSGVVKSISVKEGDKVSEGDLILDLEVEGSVISAPVATATPATSKAESAPVEKKIAAAAPASDQNSAVLSTPSKKVHAGPAVRMLARELGVELSLVRATGPRGRIVKEDLHAYVKAAVKSSIAAPTQAVSSGTGIPQVPDVDFSQFGEIEIVKMSKIQRLTAQNMSRNALVVPHVTQFDKADITDLEAFRKGLKGEMEKKGIKLTPLPFLIKAAAQALVENPSFNVSLKADGESYVQKHYVNIGIAVDSPIGLVVPVLRDVDKKSVLQIAEEANVLIKKALSKQLKPNDMQGGCFTISSLGAIGGTGFTPIVNCPEVGILGVSKADIEPKWNGKEFEPRTMLPLCLSYDHRAVNGGDAGRFMTYLNSILSDLRRMVL
ncbi:pyruvate dehydrogenase complex dihydrolipoyllysine-residue acetyltransferase [Marinomonas sp. 15G1-11]|uniref:Acetyltransferase component of pyruvate dehydrogenase complex n=1 Tax=Marinomonas phaeophyticola TaxID=3004091 RepID=A0ABT4JQ21_9GAMM|nr:pyruvate dehydrogenase complex dihydrolipoyllysine-residue acetyltransferase [Marinomonas sp. 15G1-11]MCZ2720463.1 pyruvate dehydrogenase complex dihydrolipoyllysine-residue acetyltransferase [Marinomonas sp. 15G1-11]